VAVITPARRTWFSNQESPAFSLGAGILLRANSDGYLFATAHHVVDGENWRDGKNSRALVAMASGVWAGADVIARHKSLDLALLWIPRQAGHAEFVQPITAAIEGEPVFVIGHPKGLKFTLSSGMVSRREPEVGLLQISAPVSPGNSGGPVFDDRGNLIGIVVSQAVGSDAQNLNFAVGAEALLQDAGWSFSDSGKQRFAEFSGARERQNALHRQPAPARAAGSRNQEN
jgi:serine protease Do